MKKILIISLLVLFGCSKEELPDSNYAMAVLTAYASEGGYVRPIKSNKGRLQFTIVRPSGSEITIDALPADGYYFLVVLRWTYRLQKVLIHSQTLHFTN